MSTTPTQPPNAPATQNNYNVGGSLIVPPQPNVMSYALRQDQFQTLCDGEMSTSRSIRDACIGAFATGLVGIAGILMTIDWQTAEKQGRHPTACIVVLSTLTLTALVVGLIEWKRMNQTCNNSTYARLVSSIKGYFGL